MFQFGTRFAKFTVFAQSIKRNISLDTLEISEKKKKHFMHPEEIHLIQTQNSPQNESLSLSNFK